MRYLGQADLVESIHETGARVRSYDLSPWGGPPVFMGPVEQPLPTGTLDRGNLRLETLTGGVWLLQEGDPLPTIGAPGGALRLWPFLAIAGVAWFLGNAARRR